MSYRQSIWVQKSGPIARVICCTKPMWSHDCDSSDISLLLLSLLLCLLAFIKPSIHLLIITLNEVPILRLKCRGDECAWCCLHLLYEFRKIMLSSLCYNTGQHLMGEKTAVRSHVSICTTKPSGFLDCNYEGHGLVLSSYNDYCMPIFTTFATHCPWLVQLYSAWVSLLL